MCRSLLDARPPISGSLLWMGGAWNVILACALAATVGCGLLPEQVPIFEARLRGDGRTLQLFTGGCEGKITVKVHEQSSVEVTVTVTARGADGSDCMEEATVVLREKLGDRTLVDGSTGDVVVVE